MRILRGRRGLWGRGDGGAGEVLVIAVIWAPMPVTWAERRARAAADRTLTSAPVSGLRRVMRGLSPMQFIALSSSAIAARCISVANEP